MGQQHAHAAAMGHGQAHRLSVMVSNCLLIKMLGKYEKILFMRKSKIYLRDKVAGLVLIYLVSFCCCIACFCCCFFYAISHVALQ